MVQIRLASQEDQQIIADFQMKMAMETENFQLDPETVSTGVNAVLRDPAKGKYFVAEVDGQVVASLLITFEWSDWRNKWVAWIQSVYVIEEYRQKGIFKSMYEHVRSWAQNDSEIAGLRLYVDKSNLRAIKVYQKIGMNGEHYQLFEWMED
jgi:GNAT superfamily N-acetyltransferase